MRHRHNKPAMLTPTVGVHIITAALFVKPQGCPLWVHTLNLLLRFA